MSVLLLMLLAAEDGGASGSAVVEDRASQRSPRETDLEAFEPTPTPSVPAAVESFAPPTPVGLSARVYGNVQGWTSLDTRFDSPPGADLAENVAELRLRTLLGIDVKVNEHLRVVVEGRAQFRGATQRDFQRTKGFFEPMLGDAYVDLYTKKLDLRVGNQRIPFGANVGFAPADALNPRDLRESFLFGDPEDVLLPVFAIRARGELGKVGITAAYVPFFTPHRYFVFGQDEALIQPSAQATVQNTRIDPSIEDYIQDSILTTKRPAPFVGDIAVRAVSTGEYKVGASWVWMNEKLPIVMMDAELGALMKQIQAGGGVNPALATSVANRLQAGETLYSGTYGRQHIFSLEGSKLIGPGQLDVDVSYSPRQTFWDASFQALSKSALTWVLGYTQASDSPFFWGVNYLGMAVPGVKANEQLFLFEPATAVGAERVAWFHLVAAFVSYAFWNKRVEVSMRAAFEVVQRSFALAPRVTYQGVDGLKVYLAAEFYEGNPYSAFGYFDRNDKVLLGLRWDLF